MIELLKNANIAIIGGGKFCRIFLEFLDDPEFHFEKPSVLGVADSGKQGEGLQFAREKNIFTTDSYQKLFSLTGLEVLI
jgi:two-component system NtrC family sensor kinase